MASSIPRATTCPAFSSPNSVDSSPRGQGFLLPAWSRPAPLSVTAISSKAILATTLALYTLVLLGLPLLYSRFSREQDGINGGLVVENAASADLPGILASALGSRRLALEKNAATDIWHDVGHFAATAAQLPRVEYRDAGNAIPLVDALNISQWPSELPLYLASPLPPNLAVGQRQAVVWGSGSSDANQALASDGSAAPFPAICPRGDIRLYVAITSRCCTAEAQAKRAAIRKSWMRHAREHLPDVQIHFVLAQPSTEPDLRTALELLKGEIAQHADLIIVPGVDSYRNLPSKTLQLLKYGLSSDCHYTHILKTDDDVYLRPQLLMDIIQHGTYNFSVDIQHDGSGKFDGRPAPYFQSPWMSGMYLGQLDSIKKGGVYPGWSPNRDPKSKWYLSEEDLPAKLAPLGVRWVSGWGYLLSRDLAELIVDKALAYAALPEKRPLWWGRMPWEDIMVAMLLRGVARVYQHDGFKAAWQECEPHTVLKHLDNDAPLLQEGLYAQELSGLWAKKAVVCSSGIFELNNHSDWRVWRNSLPDNQLGGFM